MWQNLLAALILSLALAGSVFEWFWMSWQQSPLDRQGPIWAVLAVLVLAAAWRSRGDARIATGTVLLLGGAALAMLGLLVDVNLARAVALIMMLTGVAALAGLRTHAVIAFAVLLLFATPTTAFLLGDVIHSVTGLGYDYGVIVKWPLALLTLVPVAIALLRNPR